MLVHTVWITGAGRGIGAGLVRYYARQGARVIATSRNSDELHALADRHGGDIHVRPGDVTDARAMAAITTEFPDIDLALFNAGTYTPTPVADFSAQTTSMMISVNLIGVTNCLAALLPHMKRGGQIGIVSSLAGLRGLPLAGAYAASKAGLIALCESLRPELGDRGIDLSIILPGFVKTPLTDQNNFPMPGLMTVPDAVDRIVAGLDRRTFRIAFPRRLAWPLKVLSILPDCLFFPIVKKAMMT